MSGWLFDTDREARTVERIHTDAEGFVYHKAQDVEPILAANRDARNAVSDYRPFAGKDMVKFASVPISVVEDMIRKHGRAWFRDMDAQRRWLMEDDQEPFRAHPAKL